MTHNFCVFSSLFFTFSQKIFNQSRWNFTWAFIMIMRCWINKVVYLACIKKYCCMQWGISYVDFMRFLNFIVQTLFPTKHYFLTIIIFWPKVYLWTNFWSKIFSWIFLSKKFSIMFWTKRCFTQIFFDQKVLIDQENCCDRFKYPRLIVYFLFMIQYDTKIGFGNFVSNHVLKWCLIYENLSQMIECRNQPKHLFQKFY